MIEIFEGGLPVEDILNRWYEYAKELNSGAFLPFIGVVREENDIEGLSFDIYLPLLYNWFKKWQNLDVKIKMAHSVGDVKVKESSFMCGVFAKHRKEAFYYIEEFVEDFKANAPIWKYDIKDGKRVFASDRAKPIKGAGILLKD